MFLVLDTETTGLPDWRSPSEAEHQPHLVSLALILLDADLEECAHASLIIKPEGWESTPEAFAAHGISKERAHAVGIPEKQAVNLFMSMAYGLGATIIAHNSDFDLRIMRIAMIRAGRQKEWLDANPLDAICTMKKATPIVNLPPTPKMRAAGFHKPKNASLTECIDFFFGERFEGAHSAMEDARGALRIHRHMLTLGQEQEAI